MYRELGSEPEAKLPACGTAGILYACDCVERVLAIYERICVNDDRPRQAIETTRRYAEGKATADALAAAGQAASEAANEAISKSRTTKDMTLVAQWVAAKAVAWAAARAATTSDSTDTTWAVVAEAASSAARAVAWASTAKKAARSVAWATAWDAALAAESQWQTQHLRHYLKDITTNTMPQNDTLRSRRGVSEAG